MRRDDPKAGQLDLCDQFV
jgi:hypothetical protein